MSPIATQAPSSHLSRRAGCALFERGFRPFFLLAGGHAALFVPLWAGMATGFLYPPAWLAPSLWHAHEMVYGFAVAAAVGFLLTAVPVWTGVPPLRGARLALLAALWVAARIVLAAPVAVPPLLAAAVDLSLPCALLAALAGPLLRPEQRRNRVFLPVLALLALAGVAFHVAAARQLPALGQRAGRVAVDAMCLLVVLVGGRIVPSFTQNALSRLGSPLRVQGRPALDRVSLGSMWAVAAVDVLDLHGLWVALPALASAATLALRMLGWQSLATLRDPLLWSLHLGFAWLPLGLALRALADLDLAVPQIAGLHAIGIGCFGSMILSVMSRVALGHTGRPLEAPHGIAFAYLAVSASALLRIASTGWPSMRPELLLASAAAFGAAFGVYLRIYAPFLWAPRVDGKSG